MQDEDSEEASWDYIQFEVCSLAFDLSLFIFSFDWACGICVWSVEQPTSLCRVVDQNHNLSFSSFLMVNF